ncbi:MAG: hypothetical protein KGZ42_08545 [Melioribacter sp.]|nr:hypothetical protein [Melioribacter sp.]
MKRICPNPACIGEALRKLLEGIYYCDHCHKFFSFNSEFIVIEDGEEPQVRSTIPGITVPMRTHKHKKDSPYIFIGIGKKGISKDLLSKKIMELNELTSFKKLSILKELDIEL